MESPERRKGRLCWLGVRDSNTSRQNNTENAGREAGEVEINLPNDIGIEPGEVVLDSSDDDIEPGEIIQSVVDTGDSQSEHTCGSESQDSETEIEYARRAKRQKLNEKKQNRECDGNSDDNDDDNFILAKVPKNLLEKLSLLSVNLKMSVRQQLSITMAVYELCDIEPSEVTLSLASCLRYRHSKTTGIAQDRLEAVAKKIKDTDSKLFLHYDTKIIEEDLDGTRKMVDRLAVVISSPCLDRDVLVCAFPLESGTGEAQADAVWTILVAVGLEDNVGGIVADTTASNFGQYRGSIVILQGYFGYPVLVIPCQHHTMELPAKHVTRLVSGRKTTGVGETVFLKYKAIYNELKEEMKNSVVPLKTFPWEKFRGSPVEELAREVVEWGKTALQENQFSRGDFRYSIKLMLRFFGVLLPDFSFERPKDTSPARFLVYGIFYLEITMKLNHLLVYNLYTEKEREEMLTMAWFSACYYLPNMIKAKYPEKMPELTVNLVGELRQLKQLHPDIANCALAVVGRHLEPVSGELVLLGIADTTVPEEEREQMGQKLFRLQHTWQPGQMAIAPVKVPDLVNSEHYWVDNNMPALVTFVNDRSFLLLDHLGWTKEDLKVFNSPFNEWHNSDKFIKLCKVIKGMSVVNDTAERSIKLIKDYIKSTRSEDGLQRTLLSVDVMRERRGKFTNSNFNNAQLKRAISGILELG